jgi:hypothetical protein
MDPTEPHFHHQLAMESAQGLTLSNHVPAAAIAIYQMFSVQGFQTSLWLLQEA